MRLTSAATLRALMDQKDVSYADLAASAKVTKGFISHLARERRSTCTPKVADAIARRLDVPLPLLFVASTSTTGGRDTDEHRTAVA